MIPRGPTQTALRASILLKGEDAGGMPLERARIASQGRITMALEALTRPDRFDMTPVPCVLHAGGATFRWASSVDAMRLGMSLEVALPNDQHVRVTTGGLPPTSPLLGLPPAAQDVARIHRATLDAMNVVMRRIATGDVVDADDPETLTRLQDAACVAASGASPDDRTRVLMTTRTPFAAVRLTRFGPSDVTDGNGAGIDASTRPAFTVRVDHHRRTTTIGVDVVTLHCDEEDPVAVMRAHARHQARSGTPWWA